MFHQEYQQRPKKKNSIEILRLLIIELLSKERKKERKPDYETNSKRTSRADFAFAAKNEWNITACRTVARTRADCGGQIEFAMHLRD